MIVLTIDQAGSRVDRDRVPDLLAMAQALPSLAAMERTVGDEAQGAFDDPQVALRIALWALRDGHWHIGIGIGTGSVESGSSASARSGDGPAFFDAREAVEESKGQSVSVAVRSTGNEEGAKHLQALLGLLGILAQRRTESQWATIDAIVEGGSGVAAANRLGVAPQTVSKSLKASAWREEADAYPLAIALMEALDDKVGSRA